MDIIQHGVVLVSVDWWAFIEGTPYTEQPFSPSRETAYTGQLLITSSYPGISYHLWIP